MSVANIREALNRVTYADMEFGKQAYKTYHDAMRAFSQFYGTGFVQTVEAFVALSPNNDYHGNLRSLAGVLYAYASGTQMADITISTYKACGERAYSYLTGEVGFLDTVKGPKITSFRHNILYPETSNRVTVDGHMVGVYLGKDLTMKQAAAEMKTTTRYLEIEHDFRKAARLNGVAPCVMQATLWAARKRERGVKYSEQGELFSGQHRWVEVPDPLDYPPYDILAWRNWRYSVKGKVENV